MPGDVKKVLIIGPALTMGGVERSSVNLANSMNQLGVDVSFIALFKQPHFFVLDPGISFTEPADFNKKKLSFFKTLAWLRKEVKKKRPDVVFAYTKFYAALVSLSLAGTNIKVFMSERSSPFYRWPFRINVVSALAFTINPPDGLVAQTKVAADIQKTRYNSGTKIRVIHNPVRLFKLYPEIARENIVLAVGRFGDANKGFDRLVKAFAMLNAPGWKLAFAGGRANSDYLKELAQYAGIEGRVEFLGVIEEIEKVYASAGIFVMPSRSEGFPNALCEGMAAGLPCVSFDFTAGPGELITDNVDGLLAPNGNIEALAEKIQYLIDNKAERDRLGKNALVIRKKLAPERIAASHLDFFFNGDN